MDCFTTIAGDPMAWVRKWKESHNKKVIGCMPMYIPEEIVAAADMLPITLPGRDARIVAANAYMHTSLCHPMRGNFESALSKDYDFLDGIVFADLCDQTKRLSNVWPIYQSRAFSFNLRLPKRLNTPMGTDFYAEELQRFRKALEKFSGQTIDDSKIRANIKLYNEVRELLSTLYKLRLENPASFAPSEVDNIVTAAMVMPKEELKQCLSIYMTGKKMKAEPGTRKPRLFVAGNPCEDMEPGLLDMIADVGGVIVDDNVYSGSMYLSGRVNETGKPLNALAAAFSGSMPCPTKHNPERSWADYLVNRAQQDRADGVILLLPKYCEVFAFDYPHVKQQLTAAGIPHLMLEVEHTGADARLKTRLEAFMEMLEEMK
ncbi:MAG: 2-hydroxyacyl-CoA dehydratase subunit D [Smithellaceae bacterium]